MKDITNVFFKFIDIKLQLYLMLSCSLIRNVLYILFSSFAHITLNKLNINSEMLYFFYDAITIFNISFFNLNFKLILNQHYTYQIYNKNY